MRKFHLFSVSECPAGLHFNPTTTFCALPSLAGCDQGSTSTVKPTDLPTTTTQKPTDSTSTTTKAQETTASITWTKPTTTDPPTTTTVSTTTTVTIPTTKPQETTVTNSVTWPVTTPGVTTPTEIPSGPPIRDSRCIPEVQDGGPISHPFDCGKYLRCSWGWAYGTSHN